MDDTMVAMDLHEPKDDHEFSASQQEEPCPVCHIPVGAETPDHIVESWASLPCGHRFGGHCIKSWLGMAEPPACPMCRQDMAHICGHPYLPRLETTQPSGDGAQAEEASTSGCGTGGVAEEKETAVAKETQDTVGKRRRSSRLMAKEAAAAAAAAAAASADASTTAGPSVAVASAPISIPSSSGYQRPSTPVPSLMSPSSSPGFSSASSSPSSASSPSILSSSVSSGSVPASPLSALSIMATSPSPAGTKARPDAEHAASSDESLDTLFPRSPPIDAACSYCFGFLEKQYREELQNEEAAAAESARVAAATSVKVVARDAPVNADGATNATDATDATDDGSEDAFSDNDDDEDDVSSDNDDDDGDDHPVRLAFNRKDHILQMAMDVFASGCADPTRLNSDDWRRIAAHWERWRMSHAKVFGRWWAAQEPQTEPAIERRSQGWVH